MKRTTSPKKPEPTTERVSIPVPKSWLQPIQAVAATEDIDRSKLTRRALKFFLKERHGVTLPAN
ncbi:MAG: hypothetical protein ACO1TE_29230 [Prosthecobacter sp.]